MLIYSFQAEKTKSEVAEDMLVMETKLKIIEILQVWQQIKD